MKSSISSSWHIPESLNVDLCKAHGKPNKGETDVLVLTSIETADRVKGRKPCHLICVIDTSGSMSAEAVTQSEDGKRESNGLTQLAIVGHAVKTIVACMAPEDTLGLVKYSSTASVVLHPTNMNEDGKKAANKAVDALTPGGSTNLWAGLKTGLEQLDLAMEKRDEDANASVLLLTDGVPNIHPPCGYLQSLQKFLKKNPDPRRSIHTFGFGYSLMSKLLCDLADIGNGSYAFIPDAGLVGTVFVHAASNILASSSSAAVLNFQPKKGVKLMGVMGFPDASPDTKCIDDDDDHQDSGDNDDEVAGYVAGSIYSPLYAALGNVNKNVDVGIGPILYGQRKAILTIIRVQHEVLEQKNIGKYMEVWLKAPTGWIPSKWCPENKRKKITVKDDLARAMAVQGILGMMKSANENNRLSSAREVCNNTIRSIEAVYTSGRKGKISNFGKCLLVDLKGQVTEALSKHEYWDKWGIHYLPSLARAHRLQLTNNFKDPGVQRYGGKTFEHFREKCDELFLSLPPPMSPYVHQNSFNGNAEGVKTVQMSNYHNQASGCIAGECMVHMADESFMPVYALRPGSAVQTGFTLNGNPVTAKIKCVVRTTVSEGKTALFHFRNGLKITPHHPIFDAQKQRWRFPIDTSKGCLQVEPCDAVYAFLFQESKGGVDGPKSMLVNGIPVIALGHGVHDNDGIAQHNFFGSRQKVEDNLRTMRGWDAGYVNLQTPNTIRDPITGLVCGFIQSNSHSRKRLRNPPEAMVNKIRNSHPDWGNNRMFGMDLSCYQNRSKSKRLRG